MRRIQIGVLVGAVLALLPTLSLAELPESNLLTGDLIVLKGAADQLTPVLEKEKSKNAKSFAPARTKLKVINDVGDGNDRKLTLVVKDVPCEGGKVSIVTKMAQSVSAIATVDNDCSKEEDDLVVEGHAYTVNKNTLDDFGYKRAGWIYGGLIIPYKYFRHDKSLEPGTTIGPFVGYRFGQTGWGVSVIGTYALTNIKVQVVDGTDLKEKSFTGVSQGIGVMFDIAKSADPFRFGVMWGKDRVGSNNVDVYPHDGKSWMALQLGWEFGR